MGVDEQTTEAERIGGRQRAHVDHRREVRRRGGQTGSRVARHQGLRGRFELEAGEKAVERIVLTHRRDQRTREVDALLPVHPPAAAGTVVREGAVRRVGELPRPDVEHRLPGRARDLIERVHPLGEVVKVLAVAVPLEPLVERIGRAALGERLADAEAALRGVGLAVFGPEPAQPPAADVVLAMAAERPMHALDEPEGQLGVPALTSRAGQSEEGAHRERIGPEVTSSRAAGRHARPICVAHHQIGDRLQVHRHASAGRGPGAARVPRSSTADRTTTHAR